MSLKLFFSKMTVAGGGTTGVKPAPLSVTTRKCYQTGPKTEEEEDLRCVCFRWGSSIPRHIRHGQRFTFQRMRNGVPVDAATARDNLRIGNGSSDGLRLSELKKEAASKHRQKRG